MHKIQAGLWVLSLLFLSGCHVLPEQHPVSESTADAALAVPEVPKAPPATDPGEPQREFEQEVTVDSVSL